MTHCRYRTEDPEPVSTLVTQTGSEIITIEEFKEHAKIPAEDDSEDTVIQIYIETACRTAENYTGRAIIVGEWQSTLEYFPYKVKINVLPIDASSIVVNYYDEDDAIQVLAATEYKVRSRPNEYTEIEFTGTIPNTFDRVDAVVIEYDAGYATVPAPFKNSILEYAAAKYENRQSEVVGSSSSIMELGFYQALFPYKLL
jgi:uncharacterized phiE125 gp8 family phage protein